MIERTDRTRTFEARQETIRRKQVRVTNDLNRKQAGRALKELVR